MVDLFVRSWVETQLADGFKVQGYVDLFVRSRVETCLMIAPFSFLLSTSSWGRELKLCLYYIRSFNATVDLFVRSWVETSMSLAYTASSLSTSSWGRELKHKRLWRLGFWLGSTSSWGRELKRANGGIPIKAGLVDLFVRSWVETTLNHSYRIRTMVDLFVRSWVETCQSLQYRHTEYRRPLREVVSWNLL